MLIELLIVVLLIGVLAAIALPAYLGQRSKAQDADAKSVVAGLRMEVETCHVKTEDYTQCDDPSELGNTGLPLASLALPPRGPVRLPQRDTPRVGHELSATDDDNDDDHDHHADDDHDDRHHDDRHHDNRHHDDRHHDRAGHVDTRRAAGGDGHRHRRLSRDISRHRQLQVRQGRRDPRVPDRAAQLGRGGPLLHSRRRGRLPHQRPLVATSPTGPRPRRSPRR